MRKGCYPEPYIMLLNLLIILFAVLGLAFLEDLRLRRMWKSNASRRPAPTLSSKPSARSQSRDIPEPIEASVEEDVEDDEFSGMTNVELYMNSRSPEEFASKSPKHTVILSQGLDDLDSSVFVSESGETIYLN